MQLTWDWRLVQLKVAAGYSNQSNYLASSFNCNITKQLAALLKSAGQKRYRNFQALLYTSEAKSLYFHTFYQYVSKFILSSFYCNKGDFSTISRIDFPTNILFFPYLFMSYHCMYAFNVLQYFVPTVTVR